jgi:hypothetical protein
MIATWKWMSWKGIVSFVPFWTIFELGYRWKMRAALGCPQCGFDPYLFLVDAKWARKEIEAHWRKKFAEKGIPYPGEDQPANQGKDQKQAPPFGAAEKLPNGSALKPDLGPPKSPRLPLSPPR